MNLNRLPDDCGRLLNGISQAELHQVFLKIQEEQFPGVFDHHLQMANEEQPVVSSFSGYQIFAPSWHVTERCPLITPSMLLALREGAKLLSVGAGPAYLERLITERFGVASDNISIADLPSAKLGDEFRSYRFNLHEEWPEFEELFDYIIFPESVFINIEFSSELHFEGNRMVQPAREEGLFKLTERALRETKPGGMIAIETQGVMKDVVDQVLLRSEQQGNEIEYRNLSLIVLRKVI